MRRWLAVVAAAVSAWVGPSSGCSSRDADAPLPPTLDAIQAQVFDVSCATTACHSALDSAGSLDLSSADASYEALVGAPAAQPSARASGWLRVEPGDAERSFLRRKLEAPGADEGDPMPPGAVPIPAQHRAAIAAWIANGAPR